MQVPTVRVFRRLPADLTYILAAELELDILHSAAAFRMLTIARAPLPVAIVCTFGDRATSARIHQAQSHRISLGRFATVSVVASLVVDFVGPLM
jgi:hypothetical protein